ncbi:hypothetical protein Bca52824_076394 [Brassica carinata]|uniref:F-box associated beta-propeller type 3 domain-containing protein n=1 Tax=Brassica carinata TaxID=52824 RepID=A0A8X7TWA7_BRACI|nr:hypothetical protein Bca52824_076394 [Brassica carinata]
MPLELCGHASGLFCLRRMSKEVRDEKAEYTEHVICNPSTILGYDPIDKVFKVVSSNATYLSRSNVLNVFTLGTGEVEWRKINSPLDHHPWSEGICINGVLYYLVQGATYYIVCFDVRSEKFKFMDIEFTHVYATRLINYEGKLGRISWSRFSRMTMWVLEDVEKHDWSKQLFTLPDVQAVYVFYFHPRRNTVKRLEVQGLEHRGGSRVYAFVDHVDDLTCNMNSWQLHQDVPPRFESFKKFRALSLLDDV